MNCSSLQNRLLALPDPTAVSDSVAAHLASCAPCQAWHRVLVQVEYAVASVAVPPSDGKKKREILAQFRTAKPGKPKAKPQSSISPALPVSVVKTARRPNAPVQPAAARVPIGERLARMWPLGLVAAALLVGTLVLTVLRDKKPTDSALAKAPSDPMLKEVVAAKVELDRAHTGADRVKVLAKLADSIHEEARTLSKVTPDEMNSLAVMYKKVVEEALVPQARSLNDDERKVTLPKYAQRLGEAEQEANRLAAESPVGSDRALREIAEAARAGRIELAKLIQGRAA